MKLTVAAVSALLGAKIERAVRWTQANAERYAERRLFVLGGTLYVGAVRQ